MSRAIPKAVIRQQRFNAAMSELQALTIDIAFEKIEIRLRDGNLHWQFFFGNKHIADYWPASAKGQIIGQANSVPCTSAARAQRLAIKAKKAMLKRITEKLIKGKNNGS